MQHKEYDLQKEISKYLSKQYPKVLFLSDTVANLSLTIPQATRNKAIQKEGFKTPDLLIFEAVGEYHGLFIELKIETPFKKNGELKTNEHLQGQQETINQLKEKGYYACFSWSFEQTKAIIDDYLQGKI